MSTVSLGMPGIRAYGSGNIIAAESFPDRAPRELANPTLRGNLDMAMHKIRTKRAIVVGEKDDWQQLRTAGSEIKQNVLANLPELLERFEAEFTARGGHVHWARDADEANRIVLDLIRTEGVTEVNKIKSMATQETGLNEHLEEHGITAIETDLAEAIVQLGHDTPSHILVPAIHRNRTEVRDIFRREIPGVSPDLSDDPAELAEASRVRLREMFFRNRVAISGANFGIAETGTLTIVESEGNGRMCLTMPDTLITLMGIEKVLPTFADLEVFLQLLPRSSTGERMNPYTSMWSGVTPGDGPQNLHVILLDNGRTEVLRDEVGRQALHCIRCSACLNVCPVFEKTGGHAYGSVYPGPIGAILSPQLTGIHAGKNSSLPYASSLCGACYDVCPVKINIPEVLVHLRAEDVDAKHGKAEDAPGGAKPARRSAPDQMDAIMLAAKAMFASGTRMGLAERGLPAGKLVAGRDQVISTLPGLIGGWTKYRDIDAPPSEAFRHWWKKNRPKADRRRPDGTAVDVLALIEENRGAAQRLHERLTGADGQGPSSADPAPEDGGAAAEGGAPSAPAVDDRGEDGDLYSRLLAVEREQIQREEATGRTLADYARGTEQDWEA